ncbi:AMIN-like domain-containing (lipo)protein [Amycolatopsis nivea]
MRRTAHAVAAAAAIAGLLTLPSCSQSNSGAPPAPSVSPTTTSPLPASTTPVSPPPPTTAPPSSTAPPRTDAPPASPSCPSAGWGTGAKEAAGSSTDALYLVRVGKHDCYDRVVFTINGTTTAGYSVRYVPLVTADPSGRPLPVPGGAVLQVVIRAPEQGADTSGHQPGRVLAATGDYLYPSAQLASWPSLRAVRFAGFFEGQCTFAVGTRAKLPFRVLSLPDPVNHVERIVLDLAH